MSKTIIMACGVAFLSGCAGQAALVEQAGNQAAQAADTVLFTGRRVTCEGVTTGAVARAVERGEEDWCARVSYCRYPEQMRGGCE